VIVRIWRMFFYLFHLYPQRFLSFLGFCLAKVGYRDHEFLSGGRFLFVAAAEICIPLFFLFLPASNGFSLGFVRLVNFVADGEFRFLSM